MTRRCKYDLRKNVALRHIVAYHAHGFGTGLSAQSLDDSDYGFANSALMAMTIALVSKLSLALFGSSPG